MARDYKNDSTFTTLLAAKGQVNNNTVSAGMDLRAYEGTLAVRVDIGVKSAGDNDGTVSVFLQEAANNTASEGTNISGAVLNTTNNTAAASTIQIDPRARMRYMFARLITSGTNSPTYPISVQVVGQKQVQ